MTRSEATVSVIMGVYNDAEYLETAIRSILDQSFEDLEFIIVDDASTDASPDIIDALDDPRLRVIHNDENKGLTWSLNRALSAAKGTYVARQDADDRSFEQRLEKQVAYMDAHPHVAVVGTGATIIDADGRTMHQRRVLAEPNLSDLQEKNHIIHGSILARKAVIRGVDGYDELFRYSQDYDLWLQLAEEHEIRNLPEALYALRLHDESIYFAKKEESLLYAMLARGRSTGSIDPETVERIRETGITRLKDEFGHEQCSEFHTELAMTYLRYGHRTHARRKCDRAREHSNGFSKARLLKAISYLPEPLLGLLHESVRNAMNAKIWFRNRRSQ